MEPQQFVKQEVINVLRKTGYPAAAEDALHVLSDPVDIDTLQRFVAPYGITQDELISRMGGSP